MCKFGAAVYLKEVAEMSNRDWRVADDKFHALAQNAPPSAVAKAADQPISAVSSAKKQLPNLGLLDERIVELAAQWFEPAARIAIFIIYFWFGFLKLIGVSPATPLAAALTSHTIGMQYFDISFKTLAVYECGLGLLFLIPAMTRISVALLIIHMGIVSSPLVIVASVAWVHPLVPTLEGQYIIKDLAIIALAIGILGQRRLSRDG
jgi:uncharacterized membrane protein YphA (DoxX/SURF4 family)